MTSEHTLAFRPLTLVALTVLIGLSSLNVAFLKVDLLAQVSGVVQGWVVDASDGAPVNAASLRVLAAASDAERPRVVATGTGRTAGDFTLTFQDPATADMSGILVVAAPGYASERIPWPVTDPGHPLEIKLRRAVHLVVELRDGQGALVPGRIQIDTLRPGNVITRSLTSTSGTISVDDLGPGFTTVIALADGFSPSLSVIEANDGERRSLRVTLQPAAVIEGTVVDGAGNPVPGAVIEAGYGDAWPMISALSSYFDGRLQTGGDGTFAVENVSAELPVRLRARLGDRQSDEVAVAAEAAETVRDIVLVVDR